MLRRILAGSLVVGGMCTTAWAADHHGRVMFGAVPVPGATVTAARGDERRATVTDQQGAYHFADIADGVWAIRVEMVGFAPANGEVTIAAGAPASTWDLKLLPFDDISRGLPPASPEPREPASAPIAGRASTSAVQPPPGGFQRAQVNASSNAGAIAADASASEADRSQAAADGFLINGSVNNGAASPFAQLAAFGNNRRSARSLYTGGFGAVLGSSTFDAQPHSFTSRDISKPDYTDLQLMGQVGGPLKIPGLIKNGGNLYVAYQ